MDKQTFPALNMEQWTTAVPAPESAAGTALDLVDDDPTPASMMVENVIDSMPAVSAPISSIMDKTLWTAHAEDTIEQVEEILSAQGLSSVPVVGSNGAIVGMIGIQELAQFHSEKKNAKVVRAWEISRIKAFEVSPADTVEDVAKLMADHKIENIAVTEFSRLQGVVSTQDLVQVILKEMTDEPTAAGTNAAPETAAK